MRELERFHEFGFRQFISRAFDHDDVVFRPDVNKIEIALVALDMSRVRDKLAIDATDANGANRTGKWNVGNAERCGSAIDCENVRIVLPICAEQNGNDLR